MTKFTGRLILGALAALLAFAPVAEAAFTPGTLVKLAREGNAKAPNVFGYTTTADALATVEVANYFQSASLKAGDQITVKASDGNAVYLVTAATATTSTIAAAASATATTAAALAANGANCSAGSFPLGVDAAGAVETCATVVSASPVWVCANGTGYETPGAVAYIASPITGTIVKYYHTLTTVVDADVILNLDIGGTNATGSATIAVAGVAVGDVDTATVSADGAVTAGALIKVESDGGGGAGAGTTCIQINP